MTDVVAFRCPHCSGALDDVGDGLRCAIGHHFDRSRDGYVNLVPSGRLKGRDAGDSADMIGARRRFLDAGHYRPVMAAVARAAAGRERVLDAGCGEGSYLAAIDAADRVGVDVSRPAIRLASRRFGNRCRFAVASSFHLPFEDDQFDAAVSVFAPRPFEELSRVLRPDGVIVVASPGPEHLHGLTDLVYDEPAPHEQRPHTSATEQRVRYELVLAGDDLANLLHMTPYWWKATDDQRRRIASERGRTIQVDVIVALWPRGVGLSSY